MDHGRSSWPEAECGVELGAGKILHVPYLSLEDLHELVISIIVLVGFMCDLTFERFFSVIIQPFASVLLDCVVFLGRFGLSIQICVLRDLVALAAFHVYCFYVYAAR